MLSSSCLVAVSSTYRFNSLKQQAMQDTLDSDKQIIVRPCEERIGKDILAFDRKVEIAAELSNYELTFSIGNP